MKRATFFFVLAVFTSPALLRLAPDLAATDDATQKAITELEYKWADAQKMGNPKAVAPMLAEGFVNTDADGQTYGKQRLLSNLKGGQWEHNDISDVKVTVYGNTAIATGAWAGKGIDGDGTKIDRAERWTDAWVKMPGGKWQCVASQQTSTPKR